MQKRRENRIGEQAFADTAGETGSEPLAISFCPLAVIRSVRRLLNAGPRCFKGEKSRVGKTPVGQMELHPRGKRLGVRLVNHIDIRYKTENALALLRLELLCSNLL